MNTKDLHVYKIESFFDNKKGWEAASVWRIGRKYKVFSEYSQSFLDETFDEISTAEKVCEHLAEL